jgi:hypothetical protein
MIILIILNLVVSLGFYNAYLLLDDKTDENNPINKSLEKKWHFIGAYLFLSLSGTIYFFTREWKYIPFVLSSFWLIFGGIVHVVGLNKPFFYVGTTAFTDKLLRYISAKNPDITSAIIKLALLISSILIIS